MNHERILRQRIRWLTWLFIIGLVISGVTAIPLRTEVNWLTGQLGATGSASEVAGWIVRVRDALNDTARHRPFLFYGTDWLAFGHFMIAVAFVGALRDPVRNRWLYDFGLIACGLVIPFAIIFGHVRGIPLWWRVVDCSFRIVGFIPLWLCRRWVEELESSERNNSLAEKKVWSESSRPCDLFYCLDGSGQDVRRGHGVAQGAHRVGAHGGITVNAAGGAGRNRTRRVELDVRHQVGRIVDGLSGGGPVFERPLIGRGINLPQVVDAAIGLGHGPGPHEVGNGDRGKQPDNGHNDHDFHQREAGPTVIFYYFHWSFFKTRRERKSRRVIYYDNSVHWIACFNRAFLLNPGVCGEFPEGVV